MGICLLSVVRGRWETDAEKAKKKNAAAWNRVS